MYLFIMLPYFDGEIKVFEALRYGAC